MTKRNQSINTIQTTVYVVTKLEIEHREDIDPYRIVAATDYKFSYDDGINAIRNTEIKHATDDAKDVGL